MSVTRAKNAKPVPLPSGFCEGREIKIYSIWFQKKGGESSLDQQLILALAPLLCWNYQGFSSHLN